ncbi:hypothetical protein [Saliphagus sp. LR7]|uniref:DUF7322 domain-containing protein n=1 Tax=Saliphagus sp. LR7 TaxID=2282654 RepID=UPI000DF807F5|nr:hypothetical protein [Saliphagus sp. LR7]
MDLEPSDHEPEEDDPEERFHDPDSEGLTIPSAPSPPSPEAPEVPSPGADEDVPSEIHSAFWLVVLTLNAAILATAVGALVLVFGHGTRPGLAALACGVALFALAARRYRNSKALAGGGSDDAESDSDTEREEAQ